MIRDCAIDGVLNRQYSNSELRRARDKLPSDSDEYSDCREVIGAAIKRPAAPGGAGGGGNNGGGGGGGGGQSNTPADAGFLNSAEEQAARGKDAADLEALTGSGDPPEVEVGGRTIKPGENGLFDLATASNDLPTPLLLALIALGLAAIAGVVLALRARAPALAQVPLLSKIRMPRVGRFRR